MGFCDYLKQIEAKCSACFENHIGACHIKLGLQEYYAQFGLSDTINIIRHNHRLTVETDIEIQYPTDYPYGAQAGKGAEFATEQAKREKRLREYLEPKLPVGVKLLRIHLHYFPDRHDPNVVALHIHAHKAVEDLDEAKRVVESLAKAIKPAEIETTIKE